MKRIPNLCRDVIVKMAGVRRIPELRSIRGGISVNVFPVNSAEPLVTL